MGKSLKHLRRKLTQLTMRNKLQINQQFELIIHKGDGTIQNKHSYGNDQNPPKDVKP
ncbi:ferredoxin-thioredoxin reductase catalytic subunit [Flavobacterium sp. 28A]|uniref:DUF2188 domain-containing protein n=1 Tax=Flavobacterium sp. 28A TaxID=2735895 RepID=UPI001C2DDC84|nr:DUF2188 domain-containing protein [Flavobacterium sp. 28A]NRT14697.1 ferredoxin-thioredoxin reductase catalytic subunit [Flavobacterium sp. 28A]